MRRIRMDLQAIIAAHEQRAIAAMRRAIEEGAGWRGAAAAANAANRMRAIQRKRAAGTASF